MTGRQTDGQTYGQTEGERDRKCFKSYNLQTYGQIDEHTDVETDKEIDRN